MIIRRVKLSNFRCHEAYLLECKKKTTLIVGENGCGKTSVLEAIYEALNGKSFRAVDREILKRGAEFYRIELDYSDGEKIVVTYDGENKRFLVGGKKWGRLPRKYRYPVVLFLPDDLHLIGASPTRKREYFDRAFAGLMETYGASLSKYNKALRQRNELLKSEQATRDSLFPWDVMLAKYGVEIRRARSVMLETINARLTKVYQTIADNDDTVAVRYEMQGGDMGESEYLAQLARDFERDRLLGHTSFGVHRDNYEFIFNEKKADGSASRGEVRSIILALKFIEADLIYERSARRPVVLLDDVFSELDDTRQKCLVQNFKDNQVIITSVDYAE